MYGPVCRVWQSCASLQEASSLYASLSKEIVSHVGILQIYEVSEPQEYLGSLWVGMLIEAVGSDLQSELEQRQVERRYWREEEIVWVLHCLVDSLSYAERNGKWHQSISLSAIYSSNPNYKLSPYFTSSLQNQAYSSSPFLSPQLKRIAYTGQWSAYDPNKANIYSVGVVLLSMALLYVPEVLNDLANLEGNTRNLVANLTHYPVLGWYVGRMLNGREQDRPSFAELESEFREGSASILPVVHPVHQPAQPHQLTHCDICKHPIVNTAWRATIPNELRFIENFASSCCSLDCLNSFKTVSLERSINSKVRVGVRYVADRVWNAADWGKLANQGINIFYQWLAAKVSANATQ